MTAPRGQLPVEDDLEYNDDEIRPYRKLSITDLASIQDPEWLIRGVMPEHGYGVMYSPPNTGKTFSLLDMLCHVACGLTWNGRRVKQVPCTYFAGEGQWGMRKRVAAWAKMHPEADPAVLEEYFHIVPEVPSFLEPSAVRRLIATLPEGGLFAVDTLRVAIEGMGSENDDGVIGRVNGVMRRAMRETGSTGWLAHHTNKGGEIESGSGALRGAADTMLYLRPDSAADGAFQIACSKQKDAPKHGPIGMRIVSVPLWNDQHGDPVFGAAIEPYAGTNTKAFSSMDAMMGINKPQAPTVPTWAAF